MARIVGRLALGTALLGSLASCSSPSAKQLAEGSIGRSTEALVDQTAMIAAKIATLGGALGGGTSSITNLPGGLAGQYQRFTGGVIVSSETFGAVWLTNANFDRWLALQGQVDAGGADLFALAGLPIKDQFVVAEGAAHANDFEHARIVQTSGGSKVIYGGIYVRYLQIQDVLGLPLAEEATENPPTGRIQFFEHGQMQWSAASGPWEILNSDFESYFNTHAGATSPDIGFPVGSSIVYADATTGAPVGTYQAFQHTTLFSSAAGIYSLKDAAGPYFGVAGGPNGPKGSPNRGLGLPVADALVTPAGNTFASFENGAIVHVPVDTADLHAGDYVIANFDFAVNRLGTTGSDDFGQGVEQDPTWTIGAKSLQFPQNPWYFSKVFGNWDDPELNFSPPWIYDDINPTFGGWQIRFEGLDWDQHFPLGDDVYDDLGNTTSNYTPDNLWGVFLSRDHAAHTSHGGITGTYGFTAARPYDPTNFMGTEWWSFHNFDTPDLPFSTFAQTFSDVTANESHVLHPFDAALYAAYHRLGKTGNCFGMALDAVDSKHGRNLFPEPIWDYYPGEHTGHDLNQSAHPDLAHDINVKLGYQLGDRAVGYYIGLWHDGEMHDPDGEFAMGLDYQARGIPTLVSMTDDFFWGHAHTVLAIDYDRDGAPCTFAPERQCQLIHIANPNMPMSEEDLANDTIPDEVIQIDFQNNEYHYCNSSAAKCADSTSDAVHFRGGGAWGGRLIVTPYTILKEQPATPFWDVAQLLAEGVLFIAGDSGHVRQATDESGRTLFTSPSGVPGTPAWADFRHDATMMNLAPIELLAWDEPTKQPLEMYAARDAAASTQSFDVTAAAGLPDGTPYAFDVSSGRQSAHFSIPSTLDLPERIVAHRLGMEDRSIELRMPANGVAKPITWTVSGFEKTRWAEFSSLVTSPGQNITMRTARGGNRILIDNDGPATRAAVRTSSGPGMDPVDQGMIDIPGHASTSVDIAPAPPPTPDVAPSAWYIASSSPSDVVLNGTRVAQWIDHVSGRTAAQPAAVAQPQLATGYAGHPTLHFEPVNLLKVDPWTDAPVGTNQSFSVLAVMRSSALPNTARQTAGIVAWWDVNGAGSAWAGTRQVNGLTMPDMGRVHELAWGQLYTGQVDLGTTPHVVIWRYSHDTEMLKMTVDGVTTSTTRMPAIAALPTMPFMIGCKSLLPNDCYQGDLSELMIFPGSISDSQVQTYTANARTTWGLPAAGNTNPCVDALGGTTAPEGARCDDGDATTYPDHCSAGSCVGTAPRAGNPSALSPTAWYHAGAAEVAIAEGHVVTWFDRTPRHLDLLEEFYNGRPTLVGDGFNGKPTIRFDGGDALRRTDWAASAVPNGLDTPYSVLAVVQSVANRSSGLVSWWRQIGGSQLTWQLSSGSGAPTLGLTRTNDSAYTNTLPLSTTVSGGQHVIVLTYSPSAAQVIIDGVPTTLANPTSIGSLDMDEFLVGAANDLSSSLFQGDISELVLLPYAASAQNAADFLSYARAEWNLQ